MTILELRVEKENIVNQLVLNLDRATQLIAYKALRGQGISTEGIDYEIDKLLRAEVKNR